MGLLGNIRDGWFNYIKSAISNRSITPEFQIEVEKRSVECAACPELKILSKNKNSPFRGKCGKCGCIFPAMIFAPGKKCPIGKWGKFEP